MLGSIGGSLSSWRFYRMQILEFGKLTSTIAILHGLRINHGSNPGRILITRALAYLRNSRQFTAIFIWQIKAKNDVIARPLR
ncbi:MAG TPA: hypothetical protein VIZ65_01660 [Cellvibrionaceae bacterium]